MLMNTKQFPLLEQVTQPTVPTEAAAFYLNRKAQTLRCWASNQHSEILPIRINGRLAWKVSEIRALVNKSTPSHHANKGGAQ